MKRVFDILVSTILLTLLGWLLIILIVISKIVHKASGVYVQQRIGKDLKPFMAYKIRSMKIIENYNSTVTVKSDPRVTGFGNLIRKFKMDELPQVINVFNGSMSIVGPRPTVQDDVEKMDKNQRKRFDVRPGITGLAQINGNTSLTWPERIEYDMQYVENQSFLLDLKIIWRTFLLIISNNAETHPQYDDEWGK